MISHFRGGDERGVAQWNGSCQKSHEDSASSHQLLVEALEDHLGAVPPVGFPNVDTMDKKLTDSLWAVAKETLLTLVTRQATQVKSEELIIKVQNELVHLVEDEQRPVQNPRNTSSTQWR